MVIMFMISACASLGTVVTVMGAVLTVVDRQHRLRSERLLARSSKHKGVAGWLQAQVLKVGICAADSVALACGWTAMILILTLRMARKLIGCKQQQMLQSLEADCMQACRVGFSNVCAQWRLYLRVPHGSHQHNSWLSGTQAAEAQS